jgi:glycosyltransferase involved in cell wall biosynthesis
MCIHLIDGIIVHNRFSKDSFKRSFGHKKSIAVIPHGNYLPFVNPLPLPESKKCINLLFFGQIKEVKGLEILLKAMKLVINTNHNYRLTIVGRPWKTSAGRYETMIRELGLSEVVSTQFNYIEHAKVLEYYEWADIVVLPYKRIYQSGVLLLSWSYGRTVIASDLDPFTEAIIDQKNGFLFKSEDAESLAACILSLNFDRIINATLGSNKTITEAYDWSNIGRATIQFYQGL